MKTLNLTPSFEPLGKGIRYESFTFSGGEPHIKLKESVQDEDITITIRIKNFNDLGALFVAKNALSLGGAARISLFLPYFPGARQDRVMVAGEPLTVKVYADLINAQKFNHVTIFDPHSDVAPALIDNVKVITNLTLVKKSIAHLSDYLLIAPDAGALKKIYHIANEIPGSQVIECGKIRDLNNGNLSGTKIFTENLNGKDCLIVDDICDGGMTFLSLAKSLREKNAGKLYLTISHGIFSKGVRELCEHFEKIFTTDSFYTGKDEKVCVVPLAELVL